MVKMAAHEQFRIMESFSTVNYASWYQEIEYLLNQDKADLEKPKPPQRGLNLMENMLLDDVITLINS